ncbi:MAG: hypothetical protein AAF630_04450 [Cyanobacteria bacterium P01_C01_bin.38]
MKRRNDNFWQRWFVVGATVFILFLFFNLLFFPLNQKEPTSLNWLEEMVTYPVLHKPALNREFWGYIGVSIGISATFMGASMFSGLVIHLFDIVFASIARIIRLPFYKPRSNHWENQYLKEKKTIWTILRNGILFVFGIPVVLTIFTYITITLEGKTFIWNALPQIFLIGMTAGSLLYIFLLLVEESWK